MPVLSPQCTNCSFLSLSCRPQESGNVHGISVTSVAILPCPSVSSAPTPSARITRREPWCRRRWTGASAAPRTTPNLLWPPSTGARSSANWKHRTLWKRQRSELGSKQTREGRRGAAGDELGLQCHTRLCPRRRLGGAGAGPLS